MRTIIGIIIFFVLDVLCQGMNLEIIREYYFSDCDSEYFLISPASFVVTDGGTLIVSDAKDTNLKVYRAGTMVQVFGNRGVGPGEFICPIKLAVSGRKLMVYDFRAGRLSELNITSEGLIDRKSCKIKYMRCDDFDLTSDGDPVLSGTYYGKSRNGHVINFPARNRLFLKKEDFMGKLFEKKGELAGAGANLSLIAVQKDYAYICLTAGAYTLLRLDMKSGDIKRFGSVESSYKALYPNKCLEEPELRITMRNMRSRELMKKRLDAKRGRCMIRNLYSDDKYLYVVSLVFPQKGAERQSTLLHVFDCNGGFIKELKLPPFKVGNGELVYYKENSREFYALTITEKDEKTQVKCTVMRVK